jgi:putative endonuclease
LFYAYVIRSINFSFLYKGHCEDLEKRLKQHNAGKTVSIRKYIPFELVYFEAFQTREEAIRRERYFKSSAGRRFIKAKMSDSEDAGSLPD